MTTLTNTFTSFLAFLLLLSLPVNAQQVTIQEAEEMFKASAVEAVVAIKKKGFKTVDYATMKTEDPDLLRSDIFFPDGKQQFYQLRKSAATGDYESSVMVAENRKSVAFVMWNEHLMYAQDYKQQLEALGYTESETIGPMIFYENTDKQTQVKIAVYPNRNEMKLSFSGIGKKSVK